jgi:2'-5' RNA ligase
MVEEHLRSFLAVPVDPAVLENLGSAVARIKPDLKEIRFVRTNNLHITLRFFGNITENDVEEIKRRINSVISGYKIFKIKIKSISAFPNMKNPRIIWAGIQDESGKLKFMAENLNRLLSGIGEKEEDRGFKAHLTIGRVRSRLNPEYFQKIIYPCINNDFGESTVNRIILYRSTLLPDGPVYDSMADFSLTG